MLWGETEMPIEIRDLARGDELIDPQDLTILSDVLPPTEYRAGLNSHTTPDRTRQNGLAPARILRISPVSWL